MQAALSQNAENGCFSLSAVSLHIFCAGLFVPTDLGTLMPVKLMQAHTQKLVEFLYAGHLGPSICIFQQGTEIEVAGALILVTGYKCCNRQQKMPLEMKTKSDHIQHK